jgi:hypothetical protein
MLPVNPSNVTQGAQVVVSFLSQIQQRVAFAAAAVFVLLLGVVAAIAMALRNVDRRETPPQLIVTGPQQREPTSPSEPKRGMTTPRQQLAQINNREFHTAAVRLIELAQATEAPSPSDAIDLGSHGFRYLSDVIRSMPDESFFKHGLVRDHVNRHEKQQLKTALCAAPSDEGHVFPQAGTIELDVAIAVFKDRVREKNFFGGRLQEDVVSLVRDLRTTSDQPELTQEEIVDRLRTMIAKVPEDQQQELRSFLEVLHRVSHFSDHNGMPASNIANSLADIFSQLPQDLTVLRVGLTINTVFTELLITHYAQLFEQHLLVLP